MDIGWLVVFFLPDSNLCMLFNAKSYLYIYIKYIWFINEEIVGNIWNKPQLICLHS